MSRLTNLERAAADLKRRRRRSVMMARVWSHAMRLIWLKMAEILTEM